MKVIFDDEKQRDKFLDLLLKIDACPDEVGLHAYDIPKCDPIGDKNCRECWENSGLEMKIPQKKNTWDMDIVEHESMDLGERIGWNKCVDYILGKTGGRVNENS